MVGAVPPRFQVSERLMTRLCFGARRKPRQARSDVGGGSARDPSLSGSFWRRQ